MSTFPYCAYINVFSSHYNWIFKTGYCIIYIIYIMYILYTYISYISICTFIYMHININIYIYIHMYIMHSYIYVCIYIYIHIYIYMYIYLYIHVNIYMYMSWHAPHLQLRWFEIFRKRSAKEVLKFRIWRQDQRIWIKLHNLSCIQL